MAMSAGIISAFACLVAVCALVSIARPGDLFEAWADSPAPSGGLTPPLSNDGALLVAEGSEGQDGPTPPGEDSAAHPHRGPAGFEHVHSFVSVRGTALFHPNARETFHNTGHPRHAFIEAEFAHQPFVRTAELAGADGRTMVVPRMDDQKTVLALALMSSDAYVDPVNNTKNWKDVEGWDLLSDFGWEEGVFGGFRGHVFKGTGKDDSGAEREVVIMAIRGTALEPARLRISTKDRIMDNKMFGCCCGQNVQNGKVVACTCTRPDDPLTRSHVCDRACMVAHTKDDPCTGSGTPDAECVTEPYLARAQAVFQKVRDEYPGAVHWLTGHSLGGSLVAATAAVPAVAFEAPGERRYAEWLGYDTMRGYDHIYHVTNDGDPIPVGRCTGVLSGCYWAGYALETRCHLGNLCEYRGASVVSVERYHSIDYVIDAFIARAPPPPCKPFDPFCTDCTGWVYV